MKILQYIEWQKGLDGDMSYINQSVMLYRETIHFLLTSTQKINTFIGLNVDILSFILPVYIVTILLYMVKYLL